MPVKAVLYLYFDSKEILLKERYENLCNLTLHNSKSIDFDTLSELAKIKLELEFLQKTFKELNEIL